ncbi:MAG: sulfatase-like hydrolase/transferase [Bacteroidota bacterium]|nr:sulfatase-like hydrolase/transferase [Bacteroidota bacterium]
MKAYFFKYLKLVFVFWLLAALSRLYFSLYIFSSFKENVFLSFIKTCYHGFYLDLSMIAYCLALPLLLLLFETITKKRIPNIIFQIYFIIVFLSIFLITLADAELFQQWGAKFNNQVLVYIQHPKEMALSAGATNWLKTTLMGIVLLSFFILIYRKTINIVSNKAELKTKHVGIIVVLIALNFILIRGGIGVSTISQSSAVYASNNAQNNAAINSMWNALYYIFNNTNNIYGDKYNFLEANLSESIFKEQFEPNYTDSIEITKATKPNYIFILLESFTASASQYFSGRNNLTPHLDQMAINNFSFLNCYASGDRTEKGLVSIFSGYPAQPVSSIIVFPDKISTMPSILSDFKKDGYFTSFIYGGDVEFASMKSYLKLNETDEIIDKRDFANSEKQSKWGAQDGVLFEKSLQKLQQFKQPFFSTILTLSSHEPYEVPYKDPYITKDKWYPYKNSLKYADECLHQFIQKCQQQTWYKNTIIVLVADHGHDIGLTDIHYFGKQKYHIPLIFMGGALNPELKGKNNSKIVSQTIIPSLVSKPSNQSKYQWQTSSNHPKGFAQYHFYNGFGRVTENSEIIFDNTAQKAYGLKFHTTPLNVDADSLRLINAGKAFQQQLIKDLLAR